MEQTARHVIFSGRVQGVGFRYTARQIAGKYDLTGYVRNMADGTVEALMQGPADDIRMCIADIKTYFGSYVRDVTITDEPVNPRYTDFQITF